MNVRCEKCQSVYRIDPAKVPEGGIQARCAACGTVIAVGRPAPPTSPERQQVSASRSAESLGGPGTRPTAPATAPTTEPRSTRPMAQPRTQAGMTPGGPAAPPPAARPAMTAPPRPAPGPPASPAGSPGAEKPRPSAPVFRPNPARPVQPPSAGTPTPPAQPRPSAPAPGPGGKPVINPFLAQDPRQKARRLARALVSDMIVYQPEKRQQALKAGTVREAFDEEIRKSWEEYVEQVGTEMANSTPYWTEALNEILAGGQKVF